MRTELKRKINFGFFANEIELTRIKDTQNEQIKKINNGVDAEFEYEVKYKNGVVAKPTSFDSIFQEENDGTKSIVMLSIDAKNSSGDSKVFTKLSSIQDSNEEVSPVYYEVVSTDKDWTFVTASLMDERLAKIRINRAISVLFSEKLVISTIILMMMMGMLYFIFGTAVNGAARASELKEIYISSKSAMEYSYRSDLLQMSKVRDLKNVPLLMAAVPVITVVLLLSRSFVMRLYPKYTFYWGDSTKKYDLRAGIFKAFGVIVVLGIMVGLVTNYIYDFIK